MNANRLEKLANEFLAYFDDNQTSMSAGTAFVTFCDWEQLQHSERLTFMSHLESQGVF